jgi:hypothetical protein
MCISVISLAPVFEDIGWLCTCIVSYSLLEKVREKCQWKLYRNCVSLKRALHSGGYMSCSDSDNSGNLTPKMSANDSIKHTPPRCDPVFTVKVNIWSTSLFQNLLSFPWYSQTSTQRASILCWPLLYAVFYQKVGTPNYFDLFVHN